MNRDELFDLADYITDAYGDFVQIKYFVYLPSEDEFYLIAGFPDDEDERIHSRAEWDLYHEPEAAAWKEWQTRRRAT